MTSGFAREPKVWRRRGAVALGAALACVMASNTALADDELLKRAVGAMVDSLRAGDTQLAQSQPTQAEPSDEKKPGTELAPAGAINVKDDSALVTRFTADFVRDYLQNEGYKAKVGTDDTGDPQVETSMNGSPITIFFYDCEDGICEGIQLSTGWDTDGLTMKLINDWNRKNRFAYAHLDDEDDPFLEMDIDVTRGVTVGQIKLMFEVYEDLLVDFEKHIDW